MKLALETTLFRALSLRNALKATAASGFREIEIGLSHLRASEASRAELRELSLECAGTGVSLAAVFGLYDLASATEDARRTAVRKMVRTIENTSHLECRQVVSELGGASRNPRKHLQAFRRSIEELIPTLENAGVVLSFEAHSGDFLEGSDEAVSLIRGIDSKAVRYLYCIAHTFTLGEESRKMMLNARDVLNYVHVADTLRPEKTFFSATYTPDVRPHQHLVPGLGDVNLQEVFSAMKEINYGGPLVLDPFSHFDKAVWAARESRRRVRRMLNGRGI